MSEKSVFRKASSPESFPVSCFWPRGFDHRPEVKFGARKITIEIFVLRLILISTMWKFYRANKKNLSYTLNNYPCSFAVYKYLKLSSRSFFSLSKKKLFSCSFNSKVILLVAKIAQNNLTHVSSFNLQHSVSMNTNHSGRNKSLAKLIMYTHCLKPRDHQSRRVYPLYKSSD